MIYPLYFREIGLLWYLSIQKPPLPLAVKELPVDQVVLQFTCLQKTYQNTPKTKDMVQSSGFPVAFKLLKLVGIIKCPFSLIIRRHSRQTTSKSRNRRTPHYTMSASNDFVRYLQSDAHSSDGNPIEKFLDRAEWSLPTLIAKISKNTPLCTSKGASK